MNGDLITGAAIGVGVGWLNATVLGLPEWVNILLIFVLAIAGALEANL